LRFQSESAGCSGYTGYVITYTLEHFDTCDTADSSVVSTCIVDDSKPVVPGDSKPVVLHIPGAVEHTLVEQEHNTVCTQHTLINRLVLPLLL
jgi:hypothetical protein